jgi:hypothetical protein
VRERERERIHVSFLALLWQIFQITRWKCCCIATQNKKFLSVLFTIYFEVVYLLSNIQINALDLQP